MTNNNKAELREQIGQLLHRFHATFAPDGVIKPKHYMTLDYESALREIMYLIADRENQLRQQIIEALPKSYKHKVGLDVAELKSRLIAYIDANYFRRGASEKPTPQEEVGGKQVVTLSDILEYCQAYRDMQIAAADAPQPIITPSVLESFAKWLSQRTATDPEANTKALKNATGNSAPLNKGKA